ncbi:MAG TPA: hypothetical protein VLM79_39530 [Kofleriaceae bacterium]|nr:hypothetical protein [Kofleriaceae bacterium]
MEVFVLFLGLALSVKLIASSADERGRSPMLWGLVAGMAYMLAYLMSSLLVGFLDMENGLGVLLIAAISPYLIAALAAGGVGLVLARLGIKVTQRRAYDVHCRENGAGRLEITLEAVRLHWEGRSQDVARSQLHTVKVDGECLRLGWGEGELLLLPLGRPQTRDGRISQSHALARLLSPGLPVAIRVDRNASKAAG